MDTAAGFGGGAGADMSNRSPMLLLAGGGPFVDWTGDADEKSPKSAPKLSFRGTCVGAEIGMVDFVTEAGLVSKNEPPLKADLDAEGCRICPAAEPRYIHTDL